MCLNITRGKDMKIIPIKNYITKPKTILLGTLAATALAVSPINKTQAQEMDSLELRKDSIELCDIPPKEILIKDDASEFEKASKAFIVELLAAIAVVGIGLLGAWEPKDRSPKS